MAQKRCRFTTEFKKRVALETLREQDTVQKIASRHKVHPNQVSAWKHQALEGLSGVFEVGRNRGGAREDNPRPAREDRLAIRGTGFFLRGLGR